MHLLTCSQPRSVNLMQCSGGVPSWNAHTNMCTHTFVCDYLYVFHSPVPPAFLNYSKQVGSEPHTAGSIPVFIKFNVKTHQNFNIWKLFNNKQMDSMGLSFQNKYNMMVLSKPVSMKCSVRQCITTGKAKGNFIPVDMIWKWGRDFQLSRMYVCKRTRHIWGVQTLTGLFRYTYLLCFHPTLSPKAIYVAALHFCLNDCSWCFRARHSYINSYSKFSMNKYAILLL